MGRKRQAMIVTEAQSNIESEVQKVSFGGQTIGECPNTDSVKQSVYTNSIGRAPCPHCHAPWAPVRNVMPSDGEVRIRYHICRRCGKSFKSVENFC